MGLAVNLAGPYARLTAPSVMCITWGKVTQITSKATLLP